MRVYVVRQNMYVVKGEAKFEEFRVFGRSIDAQILLFGTIAIPLCILHM